MVTLGQKVCADAHIGVCQRSLNFPHLWSLKIPHPWVGLS